MKNPFKRYREKKYKEAKNTIIKANQGKNPEKPGLLSAIKTLGKSNNPEGIQPLTNILCNKDKNVRIFAVNALAKLGEPQWHNLIQGNDEDFQRIAKSGNKHLIKSLVAMAQYCPEKGIERKALGNSKNPLVTNIVRDNLTKHKNQDKRFLIEILGNLKDIRAIPILSRFLKDKKHVLVATEALGNIGDPRSVEPLIEILPHIDPKIRIAIAEALLKLGEPIWKDLILGDDGDFERLGKTGDLRILQPLTDALLLYSVPTGAKGLAAIGNTEAAEALNEALSSRSGSVRKAGAQALAKLDDPFWKKLIQGSIGDFSKLGTSGHPRAIKVLIRFINNSDHYNSSHNHLHHEIEWNRATEALRKINHPDAIETLIEALGDKNNHHNVHINAAKALAEIQNPHTIEPLLNILENQEYDHLLEIAEALGELGNPLILLYYCRQTCNDDFVVRQEAAKALGKLGHPDAIDCLIEGLSEHYGDVRVTIAEALAVLGEPFWETIIKGEDADFLIYNEESDFIRMGKSKDPRVIKPLLKVLKEGNLEYRAEAALALGELGDTTAVEPLINALCSGYDDLRGNAAEALAKLGDNKWKSIIKGQATDFFELRESGQPWAFELLLKTCKEGDSEGKYEALEALYESRNPEAVESIKKALNDEDAGVRQQAVKTLSAIKDTRVIEQMSQAIKDSDIEVRLAVVETLIKTNDPQGIKVLVYALKDKQIAVRQNAAVALIEIAKQNFSLIGKLWTKIKETIEAPHDDQKFGGIDIDSAKCMTHYDTMQHTDTGIGLEIPPELQI